MNSRCLPLIVLAIILLECYSANGAQSHTLVKRQFPPRPGGSSIPLSRSRQFPPPEELEEESEEYENSDSEEKSPPARGFRGRQPPADDYADDYSYTEAPKVTTPVPPKPTSRSVVFNNRFAARPRFGSQTSTAKTTASTAKPSTASARATPAQSQRLDVVASILNRPPSPRPSSSRSIANSRTSNENTDKKPDVSSEAPARRNSNGQRVRTRGRPRQRTSTTTTTTTTTTTKKPEEDYYYYYEDAEEVPDSQPIATTTSTTTTTTTARPRPSISRSRPVASGNRNRQTPKPQAVKFDPESQFAPPPDDVPISVVESSSSTKRFTTSSTMSPSESGGIPAHLRHKYRPRVDGRFIDFLRDPNRPRELKGFDLTDYPFYVRVPEDIDFECEDRKDGYYASVPHKCQLFHYCFAGARYDFLCANYTLYDQTTFTCRFANNVDCESSAKYYFRNDDLWKETTTQAPETTTKRRRKSTPKEEDYYDDEYYYDDEEEEVEERRRRPPKRRRNRRKNRRNQSDE